MALVIDVPLNTAIADLDQALRLLLKRELDRHGFEGVDVEFDAPSREWSGKLSAPTVDLFLYDLRRAAEGQVSSGATATNGGGQRVDSQPPLRVELTYAVTAWTKAVQDEHRLLSQVLSILFSYATIPAEILDSVANAGSRLRQVETIVGLSREEKSDFWSAVGGQYKAAIDFVVLMTIESGAMYIRGPEVRSQTVRARLSDGPARTMTELMRFGGTVADGEGEPIADAWVALPDSGRWSSTNADGRFIFDRVEPGKVRIVARTMDGRETELTVNVPGEPADLVLGARKKTKK